MSFFSDESDLTDLSSEEEDVPLSAALAGPSTRRKGKQKEEYVLKRPLKPPRSTTYSASGIYEMIVQGTIDLDPEYQRDVVWPESKQIALIDSIFRNYYMPPLIFAVSYTDEGETRTCIDGKQRITSIQRFMDGLIPFKDSMTGQKLWYKDSPHASGGPRKIMLPKQYIQAFLNKQIVCVEYDGLTPADERETFQRVQMGVALTPAERIQAISSPCADIVRQVQKDVLGSNGLSGQLDWDHGRGGDFRCISAVGYMLSKPRSSSVPSIQAMEKWITEYIPDRKFRDRLFNAFRVFSALARSDTYREAFTSNKVAPAEVIMTAVLIDKYREQLSLMQLSSAIHKMRHDVRAKFNDIRTNSKVTKCMLDFMQKIRISMLKSDRMGDKPASQVVGSGEKKESKRRESIKRKRVLSEDEDEEYDNPPVKTKAKTAPSKTTKQGQTKSSTSKSTKAPTAKSAVSHANAAKPALKPNSPVIPSAKPVRMTKISTVVPPRPSPSSISSTPTSGTIAMSPTDVDPKLLIKPAQMPFRASPVVHSPVVVTQTAENPPPIITNVKRESPSIPTPILLGASWPDRLGAMRAAKAAVAANSQQQQVQPQVQPQSQILTNQNTPASSSATQDPRPRPLKYAPTVPVDQQSTSSTQSPVIPPIPSKEQLEKLLAQVGSSQFMNNFSPQSPSIPAGNMNSSFQSNGAVPTAPPTPQATMPVHLKRLSSSVNTVPQTSVPPYPPHSAPATSSWQERREPGRRNSETTDPRKQRSTRWGRATSPYRQS